MVTTESFETKMKSRLIPAKNIAGEKPALYIAITFVSWFSQTHKNTSKKSYVQ